MCNNLNKLKFCTCENELPLHKTHYWELKKRMRPTILYVGTAHINSFDGKSIEINENIILSRLNDNDCFDFDYYPEIDDLLIVSFLINNESYNRVEFGFVYTKNGWIIKQIGGGIDTMEWMEDELSGKPHYSTVKKGKIEI